MKKASFLFVWLCLEVLTPSPACAWIFPEHRDIGHEAISRLDTAEKQKFEQIWQQANVTNSHRLCGLPAEREDAPTSGGTECADFAMLPAIAGDHSCSPEDLDKTVLYASWFPRLSRFEANLKSDLKNASNQDSKINIWDDSNVTLLTIDSAYLSRAAANYSHFPLASLPVSAHESLQGFVERSTAVDAPLNAVGVYSRFHLAALAYARSGMATEAIMSEAFALHFLQDVFAGGHYAGTWGPAAQRKGTHDYYCINGLVSQTWAGDRYSGHGDAFMTDEDLRHTSEAVTASLRQFLRAYSAAEGTRPSLTAFHQDICVPKTWPPAPPISREELATLEPVLRQMPIPSEGEDGVFLPRFRIETGPFFSLSSGYRFGTTIGGISGSSQEDVRPVSRLEIIGHVGFGTAGVLSKQSDGAIFLAAGLVYDSQQGSYPQLDNRSGALFGIRMPFWLIPGDFLLLGPFLYIAKMESLQNMAVTAANGGLLRLQRKMSTPVGTFQFMLGRQFSLTLFGHLGSHLPNIINEDGTIIGSYRSVELDFPAVEYTLGRTFANKLAFNLFAQLGYALEIPGQVNLNGNAPSGVTGLTDSSIIYLRISLEGAKYF